MWGNLKKLNNKNFRKLRFLRWTCNDLQSPQIMYHKMLRGHQSLNNWSAHFWKLFKHINNQKNRTLFQLLKEPSLIIEGSGWLLNQ